MHTLRIAVLVILIMVAGLLAFILHSETESEEARRATSLLHELKMTAMDLHVAAEARSREHGPSTFLVDTLGYAPVARVSGVEWFRRALPSLRGELWVAVEPDTNLRQTRCYAIDERSGRILAVASLVPFSFHEVGDSNATHAADVGFLRVVTGK